jgi:hypothetical protein
MIPDSIRQAILALKDQDRPLREISRALKVSRNTVRRVLRERAQPKPAVDDPRVQAVVGLLPELFRACKGNAVRILLAAARVGCGAMDPAVDGHVPIPGRGPDARCSCTYSQSSRRWCLAWRSCLWPVKPAPGTKGKRPRKQAFFAGMFRR